MRKLKKARIYFKYDQIKEININSDIVSEIFELIKWSIKFGAKKITLFTEDKKEKKQKND